MISNAENLQKIIIIAAKNDLFFFHSKKGERKGFLRINPSGSLFFDKKRIKCNHVT